MSLLTYIHPLLQDAHINYIILILTSFDIKKKKNLLKRLHTYINIYHDSNFMILMPSYATNESLYNRTKIYGCTEMEKLTFSSIFAL